VPFAPGQSGNPAGRPPGARNRATRRIETMLDGEADAIVRKVIDMAKAGNVHAIGLCLRWLYPPPKDRPVLFDMPRLETTADAVKAAAAIVKAVAAGELTPSEGVALGKSSRGASRFATMRHDCESWRRTATTDRRRSRISARRSVGLTAPSPPPGIVSALYPHCFCNDGPPVDLAAQSAKRQVTRRWLPAAPAIPRR
jgi:hypothetical protein